MRMKLTDEKFLKLFNSKTRLNCANCGSNSFRLTETNIPNATIEEAVFMHCKNCGHCRLELI